MHTNTHTRTRTHTNTHAHAHAHKHTRARARTQTHTHTRAHAHKHTHARARTQTHTRARARTQTHTRTRTHTNTHARAHAHKHTHARAHAHKHTHTRARAHTNTHARAHAHAHTHLSFGHSGKWWWLVAATIAHLVLGCSLVVVYGRLVLSLPVPSSPPPFVEPQKCKATKMWREVSPPPPRAWKSSGRIVPSAAVCWKIIARKRCMCHGRLALDLCQLIPCDALVFFQLFNLHCSASTGPRCPQHHMCIF